MRKLSKAEVPAVLATNFGKWTEDYVGDPSNPSFKYKYRNSEIKQALIRETSGKCVYCESKVGHNTPGDVEHKIPSTAASHQHFQWSNLTIACTECNRRKNDYFDAIKPFIDPYVDDVETTLIHDGPIVSASEGNAVSETSIKILQLHDNSRPHLLSRKIEKIEEINSLCARVLNSPDQYLTPILKADLRRRASVEAEYSAMVKQMLERRGWLEI